MKRDIKSIIKRKKKSSKKKSEYKNTTTKNETKQAKEINWWEIDRRSCKWPSPAVPFSCPTVRNIYSNRPAFHPNRNPSTASASKLTNPTRWASQVNPCSETISFLQPIVKDSSNMNGYLTPVGLTYWIGPPSLAIMIGFGMMLSVEMWNNWTFILLSKKKRFDPVFLVGLNGADEFQNDIVCAQLP